MSKEIMNQVYMKLEEGLARIKDAYGTVIPMPAVDYQLTGTTAGMADYRNKKISFNAVLLKENVDAFIARTVPHELAHIACEYLYPDAHRAGYGGKRELHGPRFREIMRVLGADGSRCHSYDTTTVARPKSKFLYVCVSCEREYMISSKIHSEMVNGNPRRRRCHCSGEIALKQEMGKVTFNQARQIAAGEIAPVVVEEAKKVKFVEPSRGTKMHTCWNLYLGYKDKYDRRTMINVFVNEAGCTPAGASTYYYNCQKLFQAGD